MRLEIKIQSTNNKEFNELVSSFEEFAMKKGLKLTKIPLPTQILKKTKKGYEVRNSRMVLRLDYKEGISQKDLMTILCKYKDVYAEINLVKGW